ncbi:MAG TPA: alpha/beta fold hydrolase [Gaiellaceae bacterium]
MLVLLHGRGAGPSQFTSDPFFAELARLGNRAPIVVLLKSANHSYWHDRRDGAYATRALRQIATARQRYAATRVAIGGISMGGYGALHLASLAPSFYCAAGGHSAAVWRSAGATAPGAFDDADDYARNDVFRRAAALRRLPVWLDNGTDDPFRDADAALARRLGITQRVWPGGHTQSYWDRHMPQYLRWYASKCASA